jgi:drug/metabolite transporter (DMT)-like permease
MGKEKGSLKGVKGQNPLSTFTTVWLLSLILLWACNSIVVKIVVRDIPPLWAAFLRFAGALPVVVLFLKWRGARFRVNAWELGVISALGLCTFFQIFLFNAGSQYTTGGRVTLFIFSFPLFVPLMAPFMIREEHLEKRVIIGCLIAFVGLAVALRTSLTGNLSTLKGDMLELSSCLILAFQICLNKRLTYTIDKWKIFFWRSITSIILFFVCCLCFEDFHAKDVRTDAWLALGFQALAVSVFCFLSFQFIITRHNSSKISVFFFATPLFGMVMGVLLLDEAFDPGLLIGCILVGIGIYVVNTLSKEGAPADPPHSRDDTNP